MKKNKVGLFVLVVLILIFGIGKYDHCQNDRELFLNKTLAKAIVTDCTSKSKPLSIDIDYEFTVNGQKIRSRDNIGYDEKLCDSIKNKFFPVLYSSKKPSLCYLLLSERDYRQHGVSEGEVKKIMSQ